jgi:hypothetical protein
LVVVPVTAVTAGVVDPSAVERVEDVDVLPVPELAGVLPVSDIFGVDPLSAAVVVDPVVAAVVPTIIHKTFHVVFT